MGGAHRGYAGRKNCGAGAPDAEAARCCPSIASAPAGRRIQQATPPDQLLASGIFLDPTRWVIVSRAALLPIAGLPDFQRTSNGLKRLITTRYRPVQFLFAGKEHRRTIRGDAAAIHL
jgi:hypothetical protein